MRKRIENILIEYSETVQFNTDVSPEDAMQTAVDALMRIIQDSKYTLNSKISSNNFTKYLKT